MPSNPDPETPATFHGQIGFMNGGGFDVGPVRLAGFRQPIICPLLERKGYSLNDFGPQVVPAEVEISWQRSGETTNETAKVSLAEVPRHAVNGDILFVISKEGVWSTAYEPKLTGDGVLGLIGSGWMACFGLGLVIATEVLLRSFAAEESMFAPRSGWLMSGYVVAAVYCLCLHVILQSIDRKRSEGAPVNPPLFFRVPVKYWSIFYLVLGLARVLSPR